MEWNWIDNADRLTQNLKTGAFLTAKAKGLVNTMTISWGYTGIMWGKPYFIALVRPNRYTYEIIKNACNFTVSFPDKGEMSEELKICGSQSGRDIDKSTIVNFVPAKAVNTPIVDGCSIYLECKTRYVQPLHKDQTPPSVVETIYSDDNFHIMFFGEIVESYEK